MILTALHQLRFILSVGFGLPFSPYSLEKLVAATRATMDEFGSIGDDGMELIGGVPLDGDMMREMQSRRLRAAARAAAETPYYEALFQEHNIDPRQINLDTLAQIPLTPKTPVRSQSDSFVRRGAKPFLRATTTGTTGMPTSIYFSQREMRVYFALSALGMLTHHSLGKSDLAQISVSARGALGNVTLAGGAAHVGATVYQTGVIAAETALELLRERHNLPGKKPQTSLLYTYPSYLGVLVEAGLDAGMHPDDFGLERIAVGGEVVSEGLKARARELFGDVVFEEGYGITELWGISAIQDANGSLNFEATQGLIEVIDPDTGIAAAPGQIGTIVGTPFPPYRETTMLLRYDTEDLTRAVKPIPGKQRTGTILGKKRLAIRHDDGRWTTPRDVIEGLEGCQSVPLPARFSMTPLGDGVAIEVVAWMQSAAVHRQIEASLEQNGVPVEHLRLCASAAEFSETAYPLRSDLREVMFDDLPRMMEATR